MEMALENLVNIKGPLAETFAKFNPETIQHSDEITNDRRSDEELRRIQPWTADFPMYTIEDREAVLYLARRENNLIFQNIEEATEQLRKNDNYIPEKKGIETVKSSETTLRIKLSELELIGRNIAYPYFEIDTEKYDKTLNKEQRKFAERVYGSGRDEKGNDIFERNMGMLNEEGIRKTKISVLNPEYVKKNVEEGSAIARACHLSDFFDNDNSDFNAREQGVGYSLYWLRGIVKGKIGEKTLLPSELKPTYVHSEYSDDSSKKKRQKTYRWLDEMLSAGNQDKIPPVVAVRDPDTQDLLVYNGNIRLEHAAQHEYNLKVKIISNQEELNIHSSTEDTISFFSVSDFQELLGYMRLYAKYPIAEKDMPKEELDKVMEKKHEFWVKKVDEHRAETARFFGWHDD